MKRKCTTHLFQTSMDLESSKTGGTFGFFFLKLVDGSLKSLFPRAKFLSTFMHTFMYVFIGKYKLWLCRNIYLFYFSALVVVVKLIQWPKLSNSLQWCLQVRTFRGHTNEKNFVGLTVNSEYIACGSETNEVFVYHKVSNFQSSI